MGILENQRHELFAQGIASGLTADEAYVAAGFKRNRGNASRLNSDESISARVAELKAEIASKVTEKVAVDAAWLLNRLADEATADIADLYHESGVLKPVSEWPLIWRQGLVAGLDVEELRSDGVKIGDITKVKLSDRVKRLELIGKHVDVMAFREQMALTGKNGGPIQTQDATPLFDIDDMSPEALAAFEEFMAIRMAEVRAK
jgi:phage terminase small subunit